MKLNGSHDSPRLERSAVKGIRCAGAPAGRLVVKRAAPDAARDGVAPSDISRVLSALGGMTADGGGFDQARVDTHRGSGFQVDPAAVADRLIECMRELLHGKV